MSAHAQPSSSSVDLSQHIAAVPDFPKPGILFRDISPLLRDYFPETLAQMAALLSDVQWAQVDVIGGIEARGFLFAAGLAAIKNKGVVNIRKAGKLPGNVVQQSYGLEYGTDALEMQHGQGRILIVDDVLATGGTLTAAAQLARATGYTVQGFACLINLAALNQFVWNGLQAQSLIRYEA